MAKTTDVDGMLSAMTHEQFNEWCAKDQIEPIGSMHPICSVLAKIGGLVAAFMGHELKEKHFMPWIRNTKQASDKPLTPKQSASALKTHLKILAGQ